MAACLACLHLTVTRVTTNDTHTHTHNSHIQNTQHRDFDAFFRTEVELSKAKRLYQQLETRLDQERAVAQDRQGSLHERILALEAQLHKEK